MILKSIIDRISTDAVIKTIIKCYPNQKKNIEKYRKILCQLKDMKTGNSDIIIHCDKTKDEYLNKEEYFHVYGKKYENPYNIAICYNPWSQWLAFEVHKNCTKDCNEVEFIAHCLYEMTWGGFEEKTIQNNWDKIKLP